MSNRAWERRRRNKRIRMLRKRVGRAFDVSDLHRFVKHDLGFSLYERQTEMLDRFWNDYLLPQRLGMMATDPRSLVQIKHIT